MDSNNLASAFVPYILRTTLKNSEHDTSTDVTSCGNNNEQESMSDAINVRSYVRPTLEMYTMPKIFNFPFKVLINHYEEMFKVTVELIEIVYSYMLDTCPEKLYHICEQRSQSYRRIRRPSEVLSLFRKALSIVVALNFEERGVDWHANGFRFYDNFSRYAHELHTFKNIGVAVLGEDEAHNLHQGIVRSTSVDEDADRSDTLTFLVFLPAVTIDLMMGREGA
ncbi:unnamed protein product [Ceratitis capitata]|uniref:(Mediterranean fruit fly) hypothetical protein n=1 Tax=Ceratitis capitata TaxID=7213 RepID=A0A811UWR3_CERCA|nr:unnamed protein product [Ceratitis capitata]